MVRRLVSLFAALALLAVVGGCAAAGPDGPEALAILEQASEAQKNLESVAFDMTITGTAAGETFDMTLNGGGYLKGEREGDMVMRLSMAVPGMPATNMAIVSLDDRLYGNLDGTWQEFPAAALGAGVTGDTGALEQALAGFDYTKYVSDVVVDKEGSFLGEPVTKIVGTIALQDLMNGVFSQLGSSSELSGLGGLASTESLFQGVDLSDIRAAIYVSDVTHLIRAVHMEFGLEVEGQQADFQIDLSIRSVNEPVEIPEPAIIA
jgi:hypothetical protein